MSNASGYGDSGSGSGYNSDSGYGDSGYGDSSGYGSGYNSDSGYGDSSGYAAGAYGYDREPNGVKQAGSLGAGDTSLRTDFITDPYRENAFEVNTADTAWSETLSDPNPELYKDYIPFQYVGNSDEEMELEL